MAKKTKSAHKQKRGGEKITNACPMVREVIDHLGKYFDVFNSLLRKDETFWFRGHGDYTWSLTPSALRFKQESTRSKALQLVSDFKRFAEMKLERPPTVDEELKWVQLARHYGLPTRLLDWTRNAAVALYFACYEEPEKDGAVYVLNPVELNREVDPKAPRVFDPNLDAEVIKIYLKLDGRINSRGTGTIAINPTWNSSRIMVQQGVFTISGSKYFELTSRNASSLVYVEIKKEYKKTLLEELERVGITEMSIFPELEHMCNYLRQSANLNEEFD
jgi:hypothetical protein